jgi:guanosine-3',5'-bis(diphosphate) 3'-pyrophosphohydrolase
MSAAQLIAKARSYLPVERVEFIQSALVFATAAHEGQSRSSGEPYIEHPIATALYLANINLDSVTLAAALLHDVLEDTGVSKDELDRQFGADVARLVDGVTKLKRLDLLSPGQTNGANGTGPAPATAEAARTASLRKMLVAMASDIRVVLIKLADRLHNMRTLRHLSEERQQRIARETLDIYAPLAQRLGMADIKWQLEDEAFKYLHARQYKSVSRMINRKRTEREVYTEKAIYELHDVLNKAGVDCAVSGRPKHLYSTYQKLQRYQSRGRKFDEIYDLIALRVVVESPADCYASLGAVHQMWRPVPGEFDDYIANPKENLYQSLHTSVIGPQGYPLEVQIRTKEMHRIAEDGVAAHWTYKQGDPEREDALFDEKLTWLKQLLEWQREMSGDEEYLDSVKTDILQDQVFIYTPAGDVIGLPSGSTPLDFAYRVHTELGHNTVGGVVNGKLMPLNTQLHSGDTVEIRKARSQHGPSLDWLNSDLGYLATASARSKVRLWFRHQEEESNIARGHDLLTRELQRLNVRATTVNIAEKLGFETAAELEEALGTGHISIGKILESVTHNFPVEVDKLLGQVPVALQRQERSGIVVMGAPTLLTRVARCCSPVYGDEITGYITRGRGVTVHQANCVNMRSTDDHDRLVPVAWGHADSTYAARLIVRAYDRVGLLRDITQYVSAEHVNIHSMSSHEDPATNACTVTLTVYTNGVDQLSRVFKRLETVQGIQSVNRANEGDQATPQVAG